MTLKKTKGKQVDKLPKELHPKLVHEFVPYDPIGRYDWEREGNGYVLKSLYAYLFITKQTSETHNVIFHYKEDTEILGKDLKEKGAEILGRDLPLGTAIEVAEEQAKESRLFVTVDREASWRNKPIAQGQYEKLRSKGFKRGLERLTRGEASDIIRIYYNNKKKGRFLNASAPIQKGDSYGSV